jgi:nitric oxide synthase oxygenase domain/subunit
MIYLRIETCEIAMEEEQMNMRNYEETHWGALEAIQEELHDIVNISQSLYKHVKNAAANGYLQKYIAVLKEGLRSIDEDIEDACSTLHIQHEPLIYSDDADKTCVHFLPF